MIGTSYTMSPKTDHYDFLAKFRQKAHMSVIFDRDIGTSSVHLHLQITSLMLLTTTCSFHGNDSRRVSAVG